MERLCSGRNRRSAVLLLVATPLLYSVPEALLIGELASMLPVEGGYYQWVKRAFGRFWGFWNGWLSWVYSLMDMAIYPVLLIQYLRFFAPRLTGLGAWLVALALIWGATWLNLRGTRVVGTASRWFVATVLAPFGVLAAVALFRWLTAGRAVPISLTPFHAAGTSFAGALGIGVSQSIWNYSGWDNASTLGGEIEHATTAYPTALARALPLVSAVAYSVFALLPFGGLLAGDVLLYTAALALEFAALIELRRVEPGLRGAFRVPAGVPALVALGSLPVLVLVAAVVLEVRSRAIGLPGVLVAGLLAVAGPGAYAV